MNWIEMNGLKFPGGLLRAVDEFGRAWLIHKERSARGKEGFFLRSKCRRSGAATKPLACDTLEDAKKVAEALSKIAPTQVDAVRKRKRQVAALLTR